MKSQHACTNKKNILKIFQLQSKGTKKNIKEKENETRYFTRSLKYIFLKVITDTPASEINIKLGEHDTSDDDSETLM